MHTWLTRAIAALAIVSAVGALDVSIASEQAAAQDPGPVCPRCDSGVALTPDGLLANARSQMNLINSAEAARVPCTSDHADFEGQTGGYIRWRLTRVDQDTWDEIYDGDETSTWYRQECYFPDSGEVYGDLLEVQEFDAVSPQTLALVAIDDVLAEIPTQTIETSPDGEAMVAIDTWFWVDGVPSEGETATASVPGITVVASATPGGVNYDLGDGTTLECTGTGTPYSPGATSDCTHQYQTAGVYPITSTILWTGTYTVNGQGPFPIETAVARTATFDLVVNEAQAINTGSGG